MNRCLLRSLLFLSLSLTALNGLHAQVQEIESEHRSDNPDDDFTSWKQRIVVGGSLSASFGDFTYIDVSPLVGYRITKKWTTGVGFTYQYSKVNYDSPLLILDYKANVFGGRLYTEYDLFYGLFAHVEYEHLWYKKIYEDTNYGEYTGDVPALYLGGGYNFMIGENSKFQVMALYDVLNTNESLYNPLVFRVGFNLGF